MKADTNLTSLFVAYFAKIKIGYQYFTQYRCFNKSENPGPVLYTKVSVEYGFITRSICNVSLLLGVAGISNRK